MSADEASPRAGRRPGIGLLGGTFDPIHDAHIALARAARSALGLARVLLIPAAVPPLKTAAGVTPAAIRLEMVRRAAQSEPGIEPCAIEIERQETTPGPSFTVDTLRALRARYPREELWFLMGSDALADLEAWHRPEELFDLASFAIVSRPETGARPASRGDAPQPLPLPPRFAEAFRIDAETGGLVHRASGHRIRHLPFPPREISSSEIRARVRRGESVRDCVPATVADYIEANKLYLETS